MSNSQVEQPLKREPAEAAPAGAAERDLLAQIDHAVSTGDNLCYAALALMQTDYDPTALARLARDHQQGQRTGYLAEVGAEAAKHMHLPVLHDKLAALCRALEYPFDQWQHLNPTHPDWGKRINMQPHHLTETNRKWRVYSRLRAEELEDFVDLYLTKDYARYSPAERHEMQERGVRYTRMERR